MMGVFAAVGKYCPHPKILHTTIPSFCPGRLVQWEGEERIRKRLCLFPPRSSLRICLIPRHLINCSAEGVLENVYIIYQFGGGK